MEVFPLEDISSTGGPAVSQVEQMKSWDDSFTELEKALQAAYETKDVKNDVSSYVPQIPASLTVSTTVSDPTSERQENKRKWTDVSCSEVDDSSRLKLKRTSKLLPGGVTITLVGSPKESSDVSETLMRLVSDVKETEQETSVKSYQTCVSDNNNGEKSVYSKLPNVEKIPIFSDLSSSSSSSNKLLFENKNVSSSDSFASETKDSSQLSVCPSYPATHAIRTSIYSESDDKFGELQSNDVNDDKSNENVINPEVASTTVWDSMSSEIEPDHSANSFEPENVSDPSKLMDSQNISTDSDKQVEKNSPGENTENCSNQTTSQGADDEQPDSSLIKDEQSEKGSKKEDAEKNSKKDDKLKKKKFERCNIRDIKLEDELDAVTLSAQKEEQERIKRLQEAQMRALQERLQIIEVEKEALSQLFSQPTEDDSALFNSSSNNTETTEQIDDKSKIPLIKSETDVILLESSDEDKKAKLEQIITPPVESEENVIDISSSSSEGGSDSEEELEKKDDDIMVLSDDGESDATSGDPNNSGAHTNDCFNLPDHEGRVLVNVGHPPEDPDIFLAPQIAKVIKPHQIGGIRFLYDNVVENLERYKSSTGFGCILAHSMGLGKTVQVVSFVDVFLRHTPATLVLCIVPINTIQNWKAEFDMWVPPASSVESEHVVSGEIRPRDYNLYTLNENFKTMAARASLIGK